MTAKFLPVGGELILVAARAFAAAEPTDPHIGCIAHTAGSIDIAAVAHSVLMALRL